MKTPVKLGGFLIIILLFSGSPLKGINAQLNDGAADTVKYAIRLFIDCQEGCDMQYIKEKFPYVNYVRDVHEAQLYLLITRQSTAGGGRCFTIFYSGQKDRLYS